MWESEFYLSSTLSISSLCFVCGVVGTLLLTSAVLPLCCAHHRPSNSSLLYVLDLYTGPEPTAAGGHRRESPTHCHPVSMSQATDITGSSFRSYTTTTTNTRFSAVTLSTPKTTMDPILPLSIVKRKKVGMHHKWKAPTPAQQAPLEVVQEEPEPPSSASSTYSFDLSRSFSSPRSSYDSKGSIRTAATSPTPSLKAFDIPSTENQETTAASKEEKPTKMPCGTSFLHMGPPTPIFTSPVPPSSPKPSKLADASLPCRTILVDPLAPLLSPVRPPRNPLRQQRKPVPTAPLPPTPNDELASHPNCPRLRPPKVVPQLVIIQTPPLQVLRPQHSQPQLSVPRPATAPHQSSSSSSSSYYDTSRNTSTTSLSSTRTAQTTSNVALTQFEKRAARHVSTSRGRSTLRSETSGERLSLH